MRAQISGISRCSAALWKHGYLGGKEKREKKRKKKKERRSVKRRLRVCAHSPALRRARLRTAPQPPNGRPKPLAPTAREEPRCIMGAAVPLPSRSRPPPPTPMAHFGRGGGRDYNSQHAAARLAAARHAGSRSPEQRPPLPAARLETPCGAEGSSFGAPPFREQVGEARGAARRGFAMQIFVKTLTGKTITLEVRLRTPHRAHRGAGAAEGRMAAACPKWLLPLRLVVVKRGCGVASRPRCSVS